MLTEAEALELFKELDWLVGEYTHGRTTARSIPHAIDKYTARTPGLQEEALRRKGDYSIKFEQTEPPKYKATLC